MQCMALCSHNVKKYFTMKVRSYGGECHYMGCIVGGNQPYIIQEIKKRQEKIDANTERIFKLQQQNMKLREEIRKLQKV